MSISSSGSESKYNRVVSLTSGNGVKGDSSGDPCFAETKLRIEIVGVGPLNTVDVEGRVKSSPNWYVITTATGAITGTVDISTYDFVRYRVTNSDGVGSIHASGFILNSIPNNITGTFTPSGLRVRMKVTNMIVTDIVTPLPLTSLASRNSIIIENKGLDPIFIGEMGVTSIGINEGWEISASAFFSTDVTDAIVIYAIAPTGKSVNVKILELA
jgi:hypothetical protein